MSYYSLETHGRLHPHLHQQWLLNIAAGASILNTAAILILLAWHISEASHFT